MNQKFTKCITMLLSVVFLLSQTTVAFASDTNDHALVPNETKTQEIQKVIVLDNGMKVTVKTEILNKNARMQSVTTRNTFTASDDYGLSFEVTQNATFVYDEASKHVHYSSGSFSGLKTYNGYSVSGRNETTSTIDGPAVLRSKEFTAKKGSSSYDIIFGTFCAYTGYTDIISGQK